MNFYKKYKNIILGAVLVVLAFFAYSYFFTGPSTPALSSSAPSQTATVDQDLISLLGTLKTIKLDDSLFADPAFKSLDDFSQALVPEAAGRTNPFAPISSPSGK
jgi:hypothetical protein